MREVGGMKYQIKRMHLVGKGGTGASRKQGHAAFGAAGCDRPRAESAADGLAHNGVDIAQ
jgi:hypothetical protein